MSAMAMEWYTLFFAIIAPLNVTLPLLLFISFGSLTFKATGLFLQIAEETFFEICQLIYGL